MDVAGHRGVNGGGGGGQNAPLGRRNGGKPCRKGTNVSIAITLPAAASRRHARTGGQRKMSGRLYGYARVSVASDANNLEIQAGCWPTASRSSRTLSARAPGTGPG